MSKEFTFESGMQELENLVQQLEAGEMSLEDSFVAYERATKLRIKLSKLLDESDRRIQLLTETGKQTVEAGEDI